MEEQHVSLKQDAKTLEFEKEIFKYKTYQGAICERGAEDRDVVPGRPVVDGGLVLHLQPQATDHLGRGPDNALEKNVNFPERNSNL